jgi:hypothetical protein
MKKNKIILTLVFLSITAAVQAQELQARVTVLASKVSTTVDKKIFQTLQAALTNFINNRKWTSDNFQPNEKIKCSFLITIDKELGDNAYHSVLTVQAARPIYNTSYESPIINFLDNNFEFRYQEFQPIEFNENRIQGSDPLSANLTAVLAYYVNIILGMDYDSFALKAGDPFFQKAWNIVNNAPEEGKRIIGWKQFDGLRNRYFLAENFNNNKFALVHEAIYSYYRSGLDIFYENNDEGRNGMLNALNLLNTVNVENPNSMLLQFFFQGKGNELLKTFSKANDDQKTKAKELLMKLDLTNASAYKDL